MNHTTINAVALLIAGELDHSGADTITLAVVRAHNAAEGWPVGAGTVILCTHDLAMAYALALQTVYPGNALLSER